MISSMINLQITHLRFDCIADTPINLGGHYAGNNLRNGLANVMRRAICPETERRGTPTPEHVASCPACWLLSAQLDPGTVFRAYAIAPPQPPRHQLEAGAMFRFGLSLFGSGLDFLPYFVLALTELGRSEGIGKGRREANGRFHIHTISAIDPLRDKSQTLLAPGDQFVHLPTLHVNWTAVSHISQHHLQQLQPDNRLAIHFHTPLRLREQGNTFKMPDFGVLFKRLLFRIDQLDQQFANGTKRDPEELHTLLQVADSVRLVESQTRWHELKSYSGRQKRKVHLGGLMGTAVYHSSDWSPLLPWLIFGQGTQVGNGVVKGNGLFSVINQLPVGNSPNYGNWVQLEGD